jgi:hypothetical protein
MAKIHSFAVTTPISGRPPAVTKPPVMKPGISKPQGGRPPIGATAMTARERQSRYRAAAKARSADGNLPVRNRPSPRQLKMQRPSAQPP